MRFKKSKENRSKVRTNNLLTRTSGTNTARRSRKTETETTKAKITRDPTNPDKTRTNTMGLKQQKDRIISITTPEMGMAMDTQKTKMIKEV